MCCRGDVADDEVAEPHGDEEGSRPGVQVDQDQGERRDSEADLEEEERKVASDQVEVPLEGILVLELADVDVEEVDGEGRGQDVGDGEDERQDRNVGNEGDVVSKPGQAWKIVNIARIANAASITF